jgi:hypothetical protein
MYKIAFVLCCLVLCIGCVQTPKLPVFLSILVRNGTPSNPSVCPDGVQVTLSKGFEVWTSPVIGNEKTYQLIDKPLSLERQFVFTGDTKLTVTVSCSADIQTGSVKFIVQSVNQTLDVIVDGSRRYSKVELSPPLINKNPRGKPRSIRDTLL